MTASLKKRPPVRSRFLRMRSALTTSPSTRPAARRTMKSPRPVASGPITRSTDECEMSRSCQSATFSSAAAAYERSRRAMPHRFSDRIGFFLCGMADEPFCPLPNASIASPTSVRCQWRTVSAMRSTAVPRRASALKSAAWRSRATICVGTISGRRPSVAERLRLDRRVEVGVGADGAGDLADGDLRARRDERARARPSSA